MGKVLQNETNMQEKTITFCVERPLSQKAARQSASANVNAQSQAHLGHYV